MSKPIQNVIYILTNPQYPGYIKIGYASDLKSRIAALNTGALVEFVPYAVYETPKDKGDFEIHKIIELLNPILRASKFNNGKSKLKEFFKLEPEEAYELLEHIATVSGTSKCLYKVDINFNKITEKTLMFPPVQEPQPAPMKNSILPDGTYHYERKCKRENRTIKATAKIARGNIILLSGSDITLTDGTGLPESARRRRAVLQNQTGKIQEDIQCMSLNEASDIVFGASGNAWDYWKDEGGNPIKKYRNK